MLQISFFPLYNESELSLFDFLCEAGPPFSYRLLDEKTLKQTRTGPYVYERSSSAAAPRSHF